MQSGESIEKSIKGIKESYYSHLKALNPDIEGTYQSALFYYEAEILPLLPSDKQAQILDAGCGFGHLIRFLAENGYVNSGGVELDVKLHQTCVEYIGSNAAFLINQDAQTYLEEQETVFDAIISTDVIEHFSLPEALKFATVIRRALKPGGRIILRTPNMANVFGAYSRYMDLTHQLCFTEQSLAQLLKRAGFETPQLHLPHWNPRNPLTRKFKMSTRVQQWLFRLQDRTIPRCFDKNIVMWAIKS